MLGLRRRGCFSNLVSKKSVTFSNVERRIGRKRTAEGSVSMERKRSNGSGFRPINKTGLQNMVTSLFENLKNLIETSNSLVEAIFLVIMHLLRWD